MNNVTLFERILRFKSESHPTESKLFEKYLGYLCLSTIRKLIVYLINDVYIKSIISVNILAYDILAALNSINK